MKGLTLMVLLAGLFQCGKEKESILCNESKCQTEATVVDMTGMDGCGLMFELADGTRLEPEHRTYIKAPSIEDDPLFHFNMKAGQRVKISWEESLALSAYGRKNCLYYMYF